MITAQSDNFKTLLMNRAGRGLILQAFIENVPDVLCTEKPPDQRTKTYAIDFDDINSHYADLGTNTALTQLADWTVLAWIKIKDEDVQQPIVSWWDAGASKGAYVALNASHQVVTRFTGSAEKTLSTVTSPGNETWSFVGVSLGGNAQTVLRGTIDNTDIAAQYFAVSRATRNSFTAGTSAYIARAGTTYMDGRIGTLLIFNRALTHKEMRRCKYRMLTKAWGNDDSAGLWDVLVAQYECERGTGTTLTNSKTPGTHDGTLTNGPTWQSDACYSVTYRDVLSAEASFGQEIEPLGTKTSISGAALKILDTDEWFTDLFALDNTFKLHRRDVRVHLGFVGLLESEYQPVLIGKIKKCEYGSAAYTLRLGDALFDGKLRQNFGKSTLAAQMSASVTDCLVTGNNGSYFHNSNVAASVAILKCENEIFGKWPSQVQNGSNHYFEIGGTRGLYGTTAATHANGTAVREWFVADGTHPLTLCLRLLLSGGGAESTGGYDYYNEVDISVSPASYRRRGMEMSPSDAAVGDIETLRDAAAPTGFSGYQFRMFVDDNIADLKELIEKELLRPLGCYFFTRADGRLSIKTYKIPAAADVVHMINPDQSRVLSWEVTQDDILNYLEITYDWNPATGDYDGVYIASDATSGSEFGIKRREYTFKGVDGAYSPTTILDNLKTDLFARFKNPYVTCEIECPLTEMFVEIGDAVYFTNMNLPNASTGLRGIHKQLWQVIGRTLDLRRGMVKLTLADLSRA